MRQGHAVILSISFTILIFVMVLTYLRRKETFTASFSNGHSGPEIVELNSQVRGMVPAIWMDGDTFYDDKWMDKSGNGNDSSHTYKVKSGVQKFAAHGCDASFKYITGRRDDKSSLVLEKGWPSNEKYTFFHVTRYDGRHKHRIWTNVNGSKSGGVNWLSGHWGGRSNNFYHNAWIQSEKKRPANEYRWQISTDRADRTRSRLAGESVRDGRVSGKFRPLFHGAGIGTRTKYSREQSDWACAEAILFDRVLSNEECAKVERYLELKYGFESTTEVESGWTDQPVRMARAPNMCVDVAGYSKSNGGKIHLWKCHGGANQSWTYSPETKMMKDKNSGKCLDLPGGNQRNGNQLHIWSCDSKNNNQKWDIVDDTTLRKPGTNKCVDISNNQTSSGTKIQLWDCHDGGAQKWAFNNRA